MGLRSMVSSALCCCNCRVLSSPVRRAECRVTLLAKITSYSNFLIGLPGFELNELPIRSLPLVELIWTQEVLPRRFLVHVLWHLRWLKGTLSGSSLWHLPLAHATLSGSSRTGAFGRPVAGK